MNKKQQAENLERKGDKSLNQRDFLQASFNYKQAFSLAKSNNDSDSQKRLKQKIVESNKKSLADFKEISVESPLRKEEKAMIELVKQRLLASSNINIILFKISKSKLFRPNFENIQKQAKQTIPLSYSLATFYTLDEDGDEIPGGYDSEYAWFIQMYELHQRLLMTLYLRSIFSDLIKEKRLTYQNFCSYLEDQEFLDKKSLSSLKKSFKFFFEDDYSTFLEKIVPKFETIFLNLSKKKGFDTIVVERGKEFATRTKTLSKEDMDSEELISIWGIDFCKQIKFIFLDPLGYKLRHKIAHGEADEHDYTFENAILVFYLYISMFYIFKENLSVEK